MKLTEKHIINLSHPLYKECDKLCFASKNIYNSCLYAVKQHNLKYNNFDILADLYKNIKILECYAYLPPKVAQQTIRLAQKTYKSFFALLKAKKEGKLQEETVVGEPKYLNKKYGRQVAEYNKQTISKKVFQKAHKVKLTQCSIEVNTKIENFDSIDYVRIVPMNDAYCIEVVYTVEDVKPMRANNSYAGIDLGVNNLAAVAFNDSNKKPFFVNGRPLKSINQYYNKKLAKLRSKVAKCKYKSSHRIKKLCNKRNNKVNNFLHKASRLIVDKLVSEGVFCLVIGKNDYWKQNTNIGKINNQNFVDIPHSRFVEMLTYKCERVGIRVVVVNESHTSKCSFLDNESVEHHDKYMGSRIKRGLFKSSKGVLINADINGALNIIRKAAPRAFQMECDGVEGFVVNPSNINVEK